MEGCRGLLICVLFTRFQDRFPKNSFFQQLFIAYLVHFGYVQGTGMKRHSHYLYQCSITAATNYYKLGGLTSQAFIILVMEARRWKSGSRC